MSLSFAEALQWHRDNVGLKISDLVSATGVSRDAINKLLSRPKGTTSAENAVLISGYYGKTVSQFLNCEPVSADEAFENLVALLRPKERQLLTAQIRGILASRTDE